MSDNKDNLDIQSGTSASGSQHTKKPVTVSKESVVAMISATLVSQYLPRYWAPANNVWTQIAITVSLVVFGFICLAFTNQGSAFKTLLKDAGIELRRVTWPTKDETARYTWQVILIMIIFGIIIWLLDMFFSYIVGLII